MIAAMLGKTWARRALGLHVLFLALGGAHLAAQTTVVVTAVLPTAESPPPLASLRDLFIALDTGVTRAQAPTGVDGGYPNTLQRTISTPDGRYIVAPSLRLPATVPISYPLVYRDLLTGVTGAIGSDIREVVADPRGATVFGAFWNGDIGRLDVTGFRRVPVCETQNAAYALAVAQDGTEVYAACFSSLRVLDARTLAERRRFTLAASPREMHVVAGARLFSLDYAGPFPFAIMEMSIYDIATGSRVANQPTPIAGMGLSWAVPAPRGERIVVGVGLRPHVIDSATAAVVETWPVDRVTKVAFTSDGIRAILLRELLPASGLTQILQGVLLDVTSRTVLAEVPVGFIAYPGMSNVIVLEPPLAPASLTAAVAGGEVTLTWTMPPTSRIPTDYVIEAGSAPTTFDLFTARLGSDQASYVATGVPQGIYYVRVRGLNATGAGQPSTTVEVRVR